MHGRPVIQYDRSISRDRRGWRQVFRANGDGVGHQELLALMILFRMRVGCTLA
ncbi:hypothetical protein L286_11210 [Sphingobium sp. HDIP04]|nr:hypothetical protein L286_11210 [Sphingobium sp. HDIP04]